MKTVFLRVHEKDKASALKALIGRLGSGSYSVDPQTFTNLPRSPFGYWVSDRVRDLYAALSAVEDGGRHVASGGKTLDDFRWIRADWETGLEPHSPWVGFAKGGIFSRFYADVYLQVDWHDNARSLKEYLVRYRSSRGWSPNWTAELHGSSYYFRPGVTWPRRTQGGLSIRAMPEGCIFGDKGPAAFAADDNAIGLLWLLAVANSRPFRVLVDLQMAFGSYEVGVIQRTPVPQLSSSDEACLAALARRAWSLKRSLDTRTETSHAFVKPALLQVNGATVAARAAAWNEHARAVDAQLIAVQAEIDERCFALYGIDDEDRRAITEGFGAYASDSETDEDEDEDADDEQEAGTDIVLLAAELVSWAFGVAVGRFDVRLATGDRPQPTEPEPFDPLPVCSPAMLTGDDGLPLAGPPAGYPLSFPDDGILVDDPGHPLDVTAAVRAVFEATFGSRADAVWHEVAALLDPRDHDMRRWLASGFFEHHLRRYSKSRRKAPIFWQLGIPSGRYSVWCYAHRMTRDSLLAIQNDIVVPKLATEERRLSSLVAQAGQTPSARERAEIATQQAFVDELRTMADEVRHVAPLWNPDLDDGIVIVTGPLWRLIPTHKVWQRELRTKWDELVAGKYDWAHVAMHLWPERVVPKCASDRSLAIANGLEDVFWAEGTDGKWAARKNPTRPIAEIVAERSSPAIKAALTGLIDSPSPIGGRQRRQNSRETF